MADVSSIPNFHIKVVFIAHFFLTAIALMSSWTRYSYVFYNFILLLMLLWAIHKQESDEPLQMAIFVNALAVILDIILLAMHFPSGYGAKEHFTAIVAILQLIIRPFSCIFLAKFLQERNNALGGGMGNLFASPRSRNYEDIDKNVPPSNSSQGGYDFTAAQEI